MKLIDIVVVLGLAWYGFQGWKSGLIKSLISLISLIVGGIFAVPLSTRLQQILSPSTENYYLIILLGAFLLCFAGFYLIGKLFKVGFSFVLPDIVDKLLGAAFGALKVLFCAGVVFYCIESIDSIQRIFTPESKTNSIVYKPAYRTAAILLPKIMDFNTYLSNNPNVKRIKSDFFEKNKN